MRLRIHYLLLLSVFGCKGKNPPSSRNDSVMVVNVAPDSLKKPASTEADGTFNQSFYKKELRLESGNYSIVLWKYAGSGVDSDGGPDPRDYQMNRVLLVANKLTHKMDTAVLGAIEATEEDVHIVDLSRKLGFDRPFLLVTWEGDDDNTSCAYMGYDNHDLLKEIFSAINQGVVRLTRKNKWTLTGDSSARDLLTGGYYDCPLTISLRDYSTHVREPDTIDIRFTTQATDTIHASRVSSSGQLTYPYIIQPGTPFRVDTIYLSRGIVQLSIGDSIILRAKRQDVEDRIKRDNAG